MNHENDVKVRGLLPVEHVHLAIIPYTKYSRPIAFAYSIWCMDLTAKT